MAIANHLTLSHLIPIVYKNFYYAVSRNHKTLIYKGLYII